MVMKRRKKIRSKIKMKVKSFRKKAIKKVKAQNVRKAARQADILLKKGTRRGVVQ